MPFCSQCGSQVRSVDTYCGRCGARQPADWQAPPRATEVLANLNPRTASILCYVPAAGWIFSIIVLASTRFRQNRLVRFHAFQGLYLFIAWLMEDWVLKPLFFLRILHLNQLIEVALLIMSIFMMVKASRDQAYALPLFGELAHRSLMDD